MAKSYLFYSPERLLTLIERHDDFHTISDLVIKAEEELTGHTKEEIIDNTIDRLKVMRQSRDEGMKVTNSKSGMVDSEAIKLTKAMEENKTLISPLQAKAATYALAIMNFNAIMGMIVAAPTAGSAGIIPGVVLAYQEAFDLSDEQAARGILASAGIGMIIANVSTYSAAKAGCQAEIGNGSAMAATALSELRGMTPAQCINAAALALKNMLGLACDPIAGMVEVPCIKRNTFGVSHAFMASDLSNAGIESIVPFEEVMVAMNNIAKQMPMSIRETSTGGLAVSKTGRRIAERLIKIGK